MTGALILLVVGVADLVPGAAWRRRLLAIASASAAGWAAWVASGAPWWTAVIAVLVAATWTVLSRLRRPRLALGSGTCVLAVAILAAVLGDASTAPSDAPLAQALASGLLASVVDARALLAVVGAVVFLTLTSNHIVRLVLEAASVTPSEPVGATPAGWRVSVLRRPIGTVERIEPTRAARSLLGGRVLGPLERLLVLASLLAGLPVLAAGLLAAKGVIRFPEISADERGGKKAEEFLIGTFTSLAMLVVALGVCVLAR